MGNPMSDIGLVFAYAVVSIACAILAIFSKGDKVEHQIFRWVCFVAAAVFFLAVGEIVGTGRLK